MMSHLARILIVLALALASEAAHAPSECHADAECAEMFGGNGDPD